MQLSPRAVDFLKNSAFKKSVTDEKEIRKIFKKQGRMLTAELLHFQQTYGGLLTFDTGVDPLRTTDPVFLTEVAYGILHSHDVRQCFFGYKKKLQPTMRLIKTPPPNPKWIERLYTKKEIEKYYASPEIETELQYTCADFDFQEIFTINTAGEYFEEFELKSHTFETKIESFAMYAHLRSVGGYSLKFENDNFCNYGVRAKDLETNIEFIAALNEKFEQIKTAFDLQLVDGWWDEITSWHCGKDFYLAKEGFRIRVYSQKELPAEIINYLNEALKIDK